MPLASYNKGKRFFIMKTTLVVMAAGRGSRFGGLKQAAAITDDGRGILDFSCYDAKKAGFEDVVFILREDILEEFKERIGNRIGKARKVTYVIQDRKDKPAERKKPFGTGQAILCCKDVVKNPFCIINADDYYGVHAFRQIQKHLAKAKKGEYARVCYELKNTLSDNGVVNRGICTLKDGFLIKTKEGRNIDKDGNGFIDGEKVRLALDTPVSRNLWGLTEDVFSYLDKGYKHFLATADLRKDEYLVQDGINDGIKEGATVKVYNNADRWYGRTYKEDLPFVHDAIEKRIKEGLYPKD